MMKIGCFKATAKYYYWCPQISGLAEQESELQKADHGKVYFVQETRPKSKEDAISLGLKADFRDFPPGNYLTFYNSGSSRGKMKYKMVPENK